MSTIRPVFSDRHRRASRRHSLNASVEVLGPVRGTGVTINASPQGLRVAVDCMLQPEAVIMLHVEHDDRPARERARVVWSRELPDGCIAGLELITVN